MVGNVVKSETRPLWFSAHIHWTDIKVYIWLRWPYTLLTSSSCVFAALRSCVLLRDDEAAAAAATCTSVSQPGRRLCCCCCCVWLPLSALLCLSLSGRPGDFAGLHRSSLAIRPMGAYRIFLRRPADNRGRWKTHEQDWKTDQMAGLEKRLHWTKSQPEYIGFSPSPVVSPAIRSIISSPAFFVAPLCC